MTLAGKYDGLYDQSIPPELGQEILRILAKHFDETRDFVDLHWQGPEAHDLFGDICRANIQQDLRSVANRTPGVTATFETTEKGGSHYTVVIAGGLVITASRIEGSWAFPRAAEFRRRNAETRQLSLLGPDVTPTDTGLVYGILVYAGTGRRLLFANLAFPDRNCEGWLHSVDLRKKYPDTWIEIYPEPVTPIAPRPAFLRQDERA